MNTPWTLLVIDDEEPDTIAATVEGVARDLGLVVQTASNGNEAMEVFGKSEVAVALVDLKLPGKRGSEWGGTYLIEALANASSPTVVIAFTAFLEDGRTWVIEHLSFRNIRRDAPRATLEDAIRNGYAEYVYRSHFSRDLRTTIDAVRLVLDCLPECRYRLRRYLRESSVPKNSEVANESELQDLVYIMLRPTFRDVVAEQSGTGGNPPEGSRVDFVVHRGTIGIECKYVQDSKRVPNLRREIEEDKRLYKKCFPRMQMLFVLIFDPTQSLGTIASFREGLNETVMDGDRAFRVEVLWCS